MPRKLQNTFRARIWYSFEIICLDHGQAYQKILTANMAAGVWLRCSVFTALSGFLFFFMPTTKISGIRGWDLCGGWKFVKMMLTFTNNTIKILGTHFSYNKLLEKKMNFYNLVTLTDCRTLLNTWKQRWLSLAGKIQVFKSLIASKPVYIATMKSLPQDVLDELHRMQKEFLWQGKRAKIKHSTMIGRYEKGGLKDVDLESKFQSLRIIWVRKILDKTNFHPWRIQCCKICCNTVSSKVEVENIWEKRYARFALPKMGRCKRDTTGIMIASNETIVICNVQPYGRGVGYGVGGWEKVLCCF